MNSKLPYRSCVGIMLINSQGLVWVGRRIAKPHDRYDAHIWQMPQGGIDAGEVPEEAAFRELAEETGVVSAKILGESEGWINYDLPEHLIGKALKGRFRGQTQKWFAMKFDGDELEIDIAEKAEHKAEFDAWRWEQARELPGLIVEFKRPVYDQVIREFAHLIEQ